MWLLHAKLIMYGSLTFCYNFYNLCALIQYINGIALLTISTFLLQVQFASSKQFWHAKRNFTQFLARKCIQIVLYKNINVRLQNYTAKCYSYTAD